jgi:hypothetical protein
VYVITPKNWSPRDDYNWSNYFIHFDCLGDVDLSHPIHKSYTKYYKYEMDNFIVKNGNNLTTTLLETRVYCCLKDVNYHKEKIFLELKERYDNMRNYN